MFVILQDSHISLQNDKSQKNIYLLVEENLVAICVVVCHYHKEVNYNYPGNMHDYQNEITIN